MKYFFYVLSIFLITVLQGTLFKGIEIFGVSANLFIIYACILCFFASKTDSITVSGIIGFLLDILTGRFVGLYTLLFVIAAFFVNLIHEKVLREPEFYICSLVVFLVSVLLNSLYYLIAFSSIESISVKTLLIVVFTEGLYDGVVSIPVYFILKRFKKYFYTDKGEYIE